ncbi:MAG: UDP-N-acetylglucosamine--N-acetylmuramyl-(pentapeptide) pyrophosphoryl-undecaprenol N-acetylglucosamine transferase [Hyphomonadaceae bacterium]|nr:UDP-N-acetylglucosamine--N-acetylmuramyl-(pentapeptide) pyrophosphoryl-undecaprenol N-acetylglucosamine transferase [Hyphomonadaceae bacterium]
MSRTALVAAGGTGGHLFPAAAFAGELRARGWRVVLMTDARGRRYAEGFPADAIEDVPAATIQGVNPIKIASAAWTITRGIAAARKSLKVMEPAIVAGFGGYPSLPALEAALSQQRPVLIHEQNAVLGRVNRTYAARVSAVACGFERLDRLPPPAASRKVVVGNPVRPAILEARDAAYPIAAPGAPLRVLVTGGSQGARLFGEVTPEAVALLPQDLRGRLEITQQAREEQVAAVRARYAQLGVRADVQPFFKDMGSRLAHTHLVVARAGASTVTELQAAGRPSILIPLAIAADDHQTANAEALTGIGAADAVPEFDFNPQTLSALLGKRLADPHDLSVRAAAARASAKIDATQRLADLAEKLASRQVNAA